MPVARFCVCGFLLPALDGAPRPCPACGRSATPAVPTVKIEMTRLQPVDPTPSSLGYKAVQIGGTTSDDSPIPFAGSSEARSVEKDDLRRRRSEVFREVRDENRRMRERRGTRGPWNNPWPAAGSFQDCVTYPLRSIVWVLVLAWAWSVLLFFGFTFAFRGWDYLIPNLCVAGAGIVILGFTHRLCQYAYASSCVDQTEMLSWPSFSFFTEVKTGLLGFVGLMTGPIPVAFLAGWFWLNGGVLMFVDRLILVELVAVALTWWLLVIVSSHEFSTVHPRAIVLWFETRGWTVLAALLGSMTAVTLILWFMTAVLSLGANDGFVVQAIFLPASLVWVFAILFLMLRWLGVRVRNEMTARPHSLNAKWLAEQG